MNSKREKISKCKKCGEKFKHYDSLKIKVCLECRLKER